MAGTGGGRANRGPAAAADNRAAIIRAAGEVFAEQGLGAPLNAIAKRAGVGQGSLYRHFPTRESLAFVAFEGNLAEIEAAVADGATLAAVLAMVVEQATVSAAFIELITRHAADPRSVALERRLRAAVEATIDAARVAGTVPAHYTVDDVMLAVTLLTGALMGTLPAGRPDLVEQAWRLMGINPA
ncbi:TetR/AcrR family transcriptional regulator [Dactylosporangium sp. NBC_01737]|uniref:TetR/AcrR family transcriptional regulator n=1 Tax=Dactylosporangium sp. NBC_01737 TaxID=2975959 RepID=UPI002E0DD611